VIPGNAGQTPIDLSNYTNWLRDGSTAASGRLTITRRHGVGVAAPAVAAPLAMTLDAPATEDAVDAAVNQVDPELEVPAFMRRVKQA
jgi:hypothetical protein